MVKLYVLPSQSDRRALEAGTKPANCMVREFDSSTVAQSYLQGLRFGGPCEVARESHLGMTVVFPSELGAHERDFAFPSVEAKVAFRQGLDDGQRREKMTICGEGSMYFSLLERMYAADVEHVFIRCEEGSLDLLRSFGAKLGAYDPVRGGVLADVSSHVLSQLAEFPADFEVERSAAATAASGEDDAQKVARRAVLTFLRHEKDTVSTVGLLMVDTSLATDIDVRSALIAATTEWVSKTRAGRALWNRTGEDLNIGDLAASDAFIDAEFLAALRQRGVGFVDCLVSDTADAIAYDKVLVDADRLESSQIQIPFVET